MTDIDTLLAAGLTLEEAEMVLARRAAGVGATTIMVGGIEVMGRPVRGGDRQAPDPNSRLAKAREALEKTQKRVGVQPVQADGEELVQVYDPDADVGKVKFYEKQGRVESDPPKRFGDWEEPP